MSGDSALPLPTGDNERVINDNITIGNKSVNVNMETVVIVEPSIQRILDADGHILYEGKSIIRGAITDAIWQVWEITYDVNWNEVSRLRSSNGYNSKFSDYATLTYL